MIAEIFPPSDSFGGAVNYNFNKIEQGQATLIATNLIMPGKNGHYEPFRIIRTLEGMAALSSRTKNPVFHCSLNPVPGEVLSDETYEGIAADYMKKMGYGDQPYVVIRHNDIEREHIHILSCRVSPKGKKIKASMERKRSQRAIAGIVKEYGLLEYERKRDKRERMARPFDLKEGSQVQQIRNVLAHIYASFCFHSIGDLAFLLRSYNIDLVKFEKEEKGKKYPGIMFFGTDRNGKKVTKQILTSDLGRGYGYTALENRIRKNIERSEPLFTGLRTDIIEAIAESGGNLARFTESMKEKGTDVEWKRTADGNRIYGISFRSDEAKFIVSGSTLGKEFSAAEVLKRLQREAEKGTEEDGGIMREEKTGKRNDTAGACTTDDREGIDDGRQHEENGTVHVLPGTDTRETRDTEVEDAEFDTVGDEEDGTIRMPNSNGGSNDAEYRKRAKLFRKGSKIKI